MIEPPIDERYERAAEVMAAIAERDEAVALLREHRSHGAVQTVDDLFVLLNRIDAFLAKHKEDGK